MKSNNLAKMIGKRVVQSCITILLVTLFVFALIQMVPGDPVANYLGATATEEQITYYRHLYGFDRPVIVPVSYTHLCWMLQWMPTSSSMLAMAVSISDMPLMVIMLVVKPSA